MNLVLNTILMNQAVFNLHDAPLHIRGDHRHCGGLHVHSLNNKNGLNSFIIILWEKFLNRTYTYKES